MLGHRAANPLNIHVMSLPKLKLTKRIATGKLLQTPTKATTAKMAEQEEDFSSLPLPDRFQHKVFHPVESPRICSTFAPCVCFH